MSDLFAEPKRERRYVRVVPELALDRMFDYIIPEALHGRVRVGQRLRVPWGNRQALAYAVDFPDKPEVERCREILEIAGEEPLIPPVLVELARWMATYYCCDFSLALKGMLPDTVRAKEDGYKKRLWVYVPEGLSPEAVERELKTAKAQRRAWLQAYEAGGGWMAELSREAGVGLGVWRALEDRNLVSLQREKMERDPLAGLVAASTDLKLNVEQERALAAFKEEEGTQKPKPILLHGVTGSGKTEIYLQMIRRVLEAGKSALVLVPEIALTPQTIERFRSRFAHMQVRIAVLHSHLSPGERHDQWQMIREGRARVVIGARSAVFAPLQDPGVIIVDEEHENGYKQEETPHYHGRDLAVMRGAFEKIPVIMGTATPSLESYHNAVSGKYRLVTLERRVMDFRLPVIHVLDLRKEKPEGDSRVLVAERMKQAVQARLEKKEQSILFLNRRGYATSLQCPKCGYVAECEHCSVPLTYHRKQHRLCCHFCEHDQVAPQRCPECEFEKYRLAGMGTQRIEDAVTGIFPGARLCRMDSDSMRGKSAYQVALQEFREGKTDILVGTQMIAKGLHFPNVTCVGVVNCDNALQLPDFRSAERVFQQLVQVAGRAGRGDKPGEVFIQSYTPFHPAIQFARHHDVNGFMEQELEFRKAHGYPPYRRMALIKLRGRSEEKTRYCAETIVKQLKEACEREKLSKVEVAEALPAPIARIKDHFRYQVVVLAPDMPAMSRLLKKHVTDAEWPEELRVTVDVDAVNVL